MMTDALAVELSRVAPGFSSDLCAAIARRGRRISRGDGYRMFGPGDRCDSFLIPIAGAVRVEHMGPSGRSVVLYRVTAGDSCVMTASCLLSGEPYQAYGYAEGEVEAVGMSASAFRDLVDTCPEFRNLAFRVFSNRIIELVEVIDEFLLHRVDLRLASWLAERTADCATVIATHQTIAAELGTAREVVSRILKDFERRRWIALNRGELNVLDRSSLHAFAASR